MKTHALGGKVVYGALFVLVLPLVLLLWSAMLDRTIHWSVPRLPLLAALGMMAGLLMMIAGMVDLTRYGHGLPMNAYPPGTLVTRGIYALVAHPIYLGALVLSVSAALWFRSSSGLYLISPVLGLAIVSWLYGFELPALQRRFGSAMERYTPLFALPTPSAHDATWLKKLALFGLLYVPWLLVGALITYARCAPQCAGALGAPPAARQALGWWQVVWLVPYLFLAIKLFAAPDAKRLLHAGIAGAVATTLGLYLYLVLPGLGVGRSGADWHWTLVSLLVVLVGATYDRIWAGLQRLSESIANSRHDYLFAAGRFRIINHSLYSGLAGAVSVAIADWVIGNNAAVLVCAVAALAGAALYAQVSWGSGALLRPFGYWGAILGGLVGVLLAYLFFHIELLVLLVAAVLCAPFGQAVGRLRCLVQGCCHGTKTTKTLGIRVWQSQSRVVALSGLKGEYIVNTQLLSIMFNLLMGTLLLSMYLTRSVPSALIVGLYFVLTGIERFTEDAYRGEKQTKTFKGLRENQWIALAATLGGILVSALPSALTPLPSGTVNLPFVATALVGGGCAAFAMSMDFPTSRWRFSRLSG
jgi:protein-S-isoprenylcysteine O-methyltransferase Ste14